MPKICYNKWHKPETEETLCPDPKNADASCALPRCSSFGPLEGAADGRVEMAVEEYEAIRLIDLLGCTQEECAAQMGVARSTVQQVYDTARRRLLRPWWRGGACTSPAETMCSAPGERSVPAGTAPGGIAVWDAVAAARACGPRKIRRL